jgi:guanylate kinase
MCHYPKQLIHNKATTTTTTTPLLVLSGPSGVGKGTLTHLLLNKHGQHFGWCISSTTRQPRKGEIHGKDYYFMKYDDMLDKIKQNEFLEYQNVHGNLYGTSIQELNRLCGLNKRPVLDIDVQGLTTLRHKKIPLLAIGILPDSLHTLETRLRSRGTEKEEEIIRRLHSAKHEIHLLQHGKDDFNNPLSDYIIINSDSYQVGFPTLERILGLHQ